MKRFLARLTLIVSTILLVAASAYAQSQVRTVATCGGLTLPANQLGTMYMDATGNLCTNASIGNVTVPGVSTAANQPTNAAQASTTLNQTGTLGMATTIGTTPIVTPPYTPGQTNPISVDTFGNTRTTPGANQIFATIPAATAAGTYYQISVPASYAGAYLVTLTQGANITAGAITFYGSTDGVTWSQVNAWQVADPTSGISAAQAIPYTLVSSATKSFMIFPDGMQIRLFVSSSMTGTGSVAISAASIPQTLNVRLNPIPKIDIFSSANNPLDVASSGATAAASSVQIAGIYKSTPPTYTDGQGGSVMLDANGNQKVALTIGNAANANNNGIYTNLLQGNAVNSVTNPIFSRTTDGTTGITIKAASTLSANADTSLVVQESSNHLGPKNVAGGWPTNFVSQYPVNATTTTPTPKMSVATGTTLAVTANLGAVASVTNFLCNFDVSAIGGTAAVGPVTITGLLGGTLTFQMSSTAAGTTLARTFTPCLSASAANTAITITTTADGTATAVDVDLSGYQL